VSTIDKTTIAPACRAIHEQYALKRIPVILTELDQHLAIAAPAELKALLTNLADTSPAAQALLAHLTKVR